MAYFKTKNPNWVNFGGPCYWGCIFYGHLVYFTAIWYILLPFGIFYGYLVYFPPFLYVVFFIWPFSLPLRG
jgi:hypothetical protein